MAVSKTFNMYHKTKLYLFTKIIALIILSWTYQYNSNEYALSKSLENGNNVNISLNVRNHRLLAKHEYQNEVPTRRLQYNESYNRDNYKLEKGKGYNNTFGQLKQSRSNNVDNYLKSYKNRYSKKKGLSKLDCYCEKKVLDKIHSLYGVGEKLRNEKKSFKKYFLKKYGIGLILFALIPSLSLIFPILFGVENWWDAIIKFCGTTTHNSDKTLGGCVLLFVFYTLIKVVKYERLKSGKDKMSLKEYCRFSKDVFI
ncbi:Plasmodium exported protein, unknown function [Plasmodium vivax]|uniref:Fam-m protein n=1 Tax=Plasmodium vivax TaxID=5855 RepID=A0A565A4L7_PLAVI|nr:Plasmodium exported protein, unknown function [Plasmodium vivax]